MYQRVDKQLLEHNRRNLRLARTVDAAPRLHFAQVSEHERERVIEYAAQRAGEILGIVVLRRMDVRSRIFHRLDDELRLKTLRLLHEQQ